MFNEWHSAGCDITPVISHFVCAKTTFQCTISKVTKEMHIPGIAVKFLVCLLLQNLWTKHSNIYAYKFWNFPDKQIPEKHVFARLTWKLPLPLYKLSTFNLELLILKRAKSFWRQKQETLWTSVHKLFEVWKHPHLSKTTVYTKSCILFILTDSKSLEAWT